MEAAREAQILARICAEGHVKEEPFLPWGWGSLILSKALPGFLCRVG